MTAWEDLDKVARDNGWRVESVGVDRLYLMDERNVRRHRIMVCFTTTHAVAHASYRVVDRDTGKEVAPPKYVTAKAKDKKARVLSWLKDAR